MVGCPACGKELSSQRGMRQHHTKVHGDPLPNRSCKGCGSDFYDEEARRTFCDDCNPSASGHNGNWKGGKKATDCERCNSRFEYYPSNKDGVYCPECVENTDEFLGMPYAEIVDPERIQRECDFCGRGMEVLVSDRERGEGRFCSRECLSKWMSENRIGEDHHQWIAGGGTYTGTWWSARRKALERDGFRCQHCGASAKEIGTNPDVHHLRPVRTFQDPQETHYLENLVSLCRSCHRNVEEGNISVSLSSGSTGQK